LDQKSKESKKAYLFILDNLILQSLAKINIAVIVLDASIKGQVATSITYIHMYNNPIIKTIHYAINITSTEAELFAIKYSINQATQIVNINCIVVITDSIHIAQRIFNSSVHPY